MSKSRYLPDIINSTLAFLIGGAFASFLHGKWYHGGWMSMLGDPPDSNPAYDHLAALFQMAPYLAGGIASGLISGFGYPQPSRILIRYGGVAALFVLLLLCNYHLALLAFVPASTASFFASTAISLVYFRLLTHPQNPTNKVLKFLVPF